MQRGSNLRNQTEILNKPKKPPHSQTSRTWLQNECAQAEKKQRHAALARTARPARSYAGNSPPQHRRSPSRTARCITRTTGAPRHPRLRQRDRHRGGRERGTTTKNQRDRSASKKQGHRPTPGPADRGCSRPENGRRAPRDSAARGLPQVAEAAASRRATRIRSGARARRGRRGRHHRDRARRRAAPARDAQVAGTGATGHGSA